MKGWYSTEQGRHILDATDAGMLMFAWEAKDTEGNIYRQFDLVAFQRAMNDDGFVPPEHMRASVDNLPKDKICEFILYPIAMARRLTHFTEPIVCKIDLKNGERFVSYYLTDYSVNEERIRVRRHVIGLEKNGSKFLTVISPSGKILIASSDDWSYEGE